MVICLVKGALEILVEFLIIKGWTCLKFTRKLSNSDGQDKERSLFVMGKIGL